MRVKKTKNIRTLLYPKIAIAVFGVILISILFVTILSRQFVLRQSIGNLDETAGIVKNVLSHYQEELITSDSSNQVLQALLHKLVTDSNTRITLIAHDGTVLADTDEDPRVMDNHRNRPEILRALSGSPSSNVRFSNTLQIDMLYHAVPLTFPEGPSPVLRVAMPYIEIKSSFTSIILYAIAGSLFFIIISIFLVIYIDRNIEQPLAELAEEAKKKQGLAFGNEKAIISPSKEITDLYHLLKSISFKLYQQFLDINAQKQELQGVLDSMDSSILVLNSQGKVIKTNPSSLYLFHAESEDTLRGKYYNQLVGSISLSTLLESVIRNKKSENPSHTPERVELTIDNRSFQVSVSVIPAKPEITILLLFTDITKLLHLEKVRRDFVANVSHELKTPITSIKGFTETLLYQEPKSDEDIARYKKFLSIISAQTNRLQDIVEDLLTLSMLEQDEGATVTQTVGVVPLIHESVKVCKEKPDNQQRVINITCTKPYQVSCNTLLVEQALINLIDNALKYSDASTAVDISVSKHGSTLDISVRDHGFGIPEGVLDRIFERFYRVDRGRSREKGGTGLGLSIVKHIMNRHHGSVSVTSREGEGSTFTLSFPLD